MKQFILAAAAIALLPVGAIADSCGDVGVSSAWVRRPPPGRTMTAAYFDIRNKGTRVLRIDAITSEDFGSTMLHQTVYRENEALMRHLDAIELAPGENFRAMPGGPHLMLGEPRSELAALGEARFDLHCAGGGSLRFTAPVLRSAPVADAIAP